MSELFKDKKIVMGIIAVVVILVAGGGFFIMSRNATNTSKIASGDDMQPIGKMTAEEIGLSMTLSPDSKKIKFMAEKLEAVKHLEWEFFYDADVPASEEIGEDSEGQKVTQSFGGETDVTGNSYESTFRELGTCSTGGKCRYDTGIESVNILIKVTKSDGSIYQVEDKLEL